MSGDKKNSFLRDKKRWGDVQSSVAGKRNNRQPKEMVMLLSSTIVVPPKGLKMMGVFPKQALQIRKPGPFMGIGKK